MDKRKLLFVGGDKRRLYTEQYFSSKGYEAVSFEAKPREFYDSAEKGRTVILPLPFTRDKLTIAGSSMSIEELFEFLKAGDAVIGGMITEDFISELSKKGVKVFDYYREDMILENAELTALALFEVLAENNIDINGANFVITGFGRTAKAIAKYFSERNIVFSVTARSENAENQASASSFNYVKLCNFTDKINEFDVIINTVPALILDEALLKRAKTNAVIVDIASAPFGVEKETAEKCGLKLIRALGLPGKYYPERAGELIGKAAESLL